MNTHEIHGGRVYQLAKQLGRPVEDLIDFSASLNPLGPPASVLNAMRDAVNGCRHYPDPYSEDLRASLAQEYGIAADSILVGNGSAEIIHFLPKSLGLRHGLIVGPTFSEFETSLRLAGVKCTFVNAVSARYYAPPFEKLFDVFGEWKRASARQGNKSGFRTHAIFVCNPNSPTGRGIALRNLRKIVRQVHQIGCWMIVDEAFMDWCPSHSLVRDVSEYPRLLILRSFTKFFAIPGIRLGYVVASPAVVESIRKRLPPWSVNHVAQAAGLAALADARFRQRSLKFMERERARFLVQLRRIPGLRVIPSQANFVMIEVPSGCCPQAIEERLQEQELIVRNCRTFSGVTRPALRLAIRLRQENHRLVQKLQRVVWECQK